MRRGYHHVYILLFELILFAGLFLIGVNRYFIKGKIVKASVTKNPKNTSLNYTTSQQYELLFNAKIKSKLEYASKNFNVAKDKIKVIVDISEQTAYVYFKNDKTFKEFTISTGGPQKQREMPEALWKITEKRDKGLTPLYGPRLLFLSRRLRNGQFIRTTIALHGTNTPQILGTPKSLGCVYFKNTDILKVYNTLQTGDIVLTIR